MKIFGLLSQIGFAAAAGVAVMSIPQHWGWLIGLLLVICSFAIGVSREGEIEQDAYDDGKRDADGWWETRRAERPRAGASS